MISHKNIVQVKRKGNRVKPKPRHIKAVHALLNNGGKQGEAMREAGYTSTVIKSPGKVTESKGFQQVMQNMGLTEELLTSCLVEDIHRKKDNRLGELTLGFKLHGKLRETQEGNKTLILITSGESATRYNLPVKE